MRLIDADALIGALHNTAFLEGDDRSICYGIIHRQPTIETEQALYMAIKALKAQEWIPVSERLPNKEGSYLITSETGAVTTAHWYMPSEWKPDGLWGRVGKKKTLAWMPLPDPWNGGEEE